MSDLYDAPALYDALFGNLGRSAVWYRALAHEAGDVLELACGTGRLTLPMARDGVRVRAVDRSAPMLDRLRARLEAEPELDVTVAEGDFRDLPTAEHALAILPYNALHHCADEAELRATFVGLARSVRSGGEVAWDCYLHDPDLYARGPGRHEPRDLTIDGTPVHTWEESRWAPPLHHVAYGLRWPDGTERRLEIVFRMFGLDVLRAAVADAGLRLVHEASDFGSAPLVARRLIRRGCGGVLGPDATKWVAVAERG